MKYLPFLFVICFAFIIQSCDPSTTTPPTVTAQVEPPSTPPVKEAAPEPDLASIEKGGQAISFSQFNETIANSRESGEQWTGSPITVALRFAGESFDCRKKSIEVESLSGGESFDKVLVSISEDGYLDDSLRGSITILRMENVNGYWKINSAKKAWKCWKNRGHTDFSTAPCN